ncbi:hypothetical protein PF010_g25559 [Phytophthora fragariae]|uniref:WLGC domain-containing protein n=1 Tax=Phytophthora fragariae TaxID=53985 RepID=A0A6G0JZD3_9STRA|nr:hypothetical protein PF010_g25559 [Phytophthora fragariae]
MESSSRSRERDNVGFKTSHGEKLATASVFCDRLEIRYAHGSHLLAFDLDHGHFWQSHKAASSIQVTTIALLLVVVGVYWYLLYLLLVQPPSHRIRPGEAKPRKRKILRRIPTVDKEGKQQRAWQRPVLLILRWLGRVVAKLYRSIVSADGKYRKVWHVLMEVPEVVLQILTLREYMAQGLDPSLLCCYASLMAFNAFVAFYGIQFRWNEATIHHILKDSIVDAVFAVFFPALVLFCSLSAFQDDLKTVKIRQRFFPPRMFERKARNYVNAKELDMFSTDFESLLGAMLLHSLESKRMLQRGLRAIVGFFFLVYGIGCIVYTVVAVHASRNACSSYPECVQFDYQWVPGAPNVACGCLAYVDRDLAPAESEELIDVTQTLAELASAGKLQTVQLVNRKINGSLPDTLQACRGLRNLVLIHTGVQVFPTWASSSFSKLEYLHIEGASSDADLMELPSDLFTSMTGLHTIHLSYHAYLPELPAMDGLEALECVYLGYLNSITELPSWGDLPSLQVVALEGLPQVRVLPGVEQYADSLEMFFVQDTPACCSGFLSQGDCNTSFPNCCTDDSSSLPPTCLVMPDEHNFIATNATLTVFNDFTANVSNFCDAAQATCPNAMTTLKFAEEDVCTGVLYRECSSESEGPGICFNEDMGCVQCVHSQDLIDMRKAEISAGCTCDKVEEEWLGCT